MNGLSSSEVLRSREMHGSNKLPEPRMKKWYDFAKEALSEKITMILIAIAVLQLFLGFMGVMELSDPIMILVVLAIVTVIAVKTGLGVQKSAAELRAKTSVRYCDVIRDGKVQTINKDELVVGDLVCVGMGQEIFADGYIVDGKISVNNAAINGETKECKKTPIQGYIHAKTTSTSAYTNPNCLFAGTTVMSGEGKMIVTDVGVNTVNGDTMVKMQTLESPKTALDIALDNLSDFISKWGTIAAVVTFAVLTMTGIMSVGFSNYFGGNVLDVIQKIAQNFSVALTIIVAAVPEGLPLIVKLVTKQNVRTMETFNILAKNPGKIPELAYVDIICTDKTGTLTTGVMTPKKIIDAFVDEVDESSELWKAIVNNICINNSAVFDGDGEITGGNSIDRAVLTLTDSEEYGKIVNDLQVKAKQVFNSSNKYSAVSCSNEVTYYKGAPEKLIEHCTTALGDGIQTFTDSDKIRLLENIKEMTTKSMRCIALTQSKEELVENELPNNMTLLGIIGVVDPVREEVPNAVAMAHKAGIHVIEITGDCLETAKAVAEECGIYMAGDLAITNDDFEAMSDDEVKSIIPKLRVISRCSPNTKLRLVTLAQEIGKSVAMTGDGVNDSPALKRADVKGQKINLSKEVAGLKKVVVGLGWDAVKQGLFGSKPNIDCDASAIILGKGDKYKGTVYYGERSAEDGCVYHHGDNLTGDGDGDDEQITVNLEKMPSDVEKIVFVVNIYACTSRKQDFGLIKNAFIRLVDDASGKEICKYNLSENYAGKTAMVFAEVYKKDGEWKFNAIGQGTNDTSISELANRYK